MITKDEILTMTAGKELDSLIAKYVFNEYDPKVLPYPYSIDIFSAWRIVEHFTGRDCRNQDFFIECWSDGEWFVSFHPLGYSTRFPSASCDGRKTGYPSAPLAICRAALLFVMEDE